MSTSNCRTATLSQLLTDYFPVSRATFYNRFFADPSFPKPLNLSTGRNLWRRTDIETWINDRATAAQVAA